MVAVSPTGVKTQGNVKVQFVITMANIAAPTNTEVTAGTALDVSCYLLADGFARSVTTNKGNAPRRLCTKKQFEQFGSTTYSIADLHYIMDPQGAAASTGVKAWEKLTPGQAGYFVVRLGIDPVVTDWAVGQFVEVWPVTLGERMIDGDPTDEFAEFYATQSVITTANRTERVALV